VFTTRVIMTVDNRSKPQQTIKCDIKVVVYMIYMPLLELSRFGIRQTTNIEGERIQCSVDCTLHTTKYNVCFLFLKNRVGATFRDN